MHPTKADLADIDLDRLPTQLRLLARVLGEDKAFMLVEQLGGTPICVPKYFSEDHVLLHILGPEPFQRLVEAYGDQPLQLPKFDSVLRQIRHRRVNELLDQGYLQREVALMTNYTVRQVINIKREAQVDDGQLDMFGGGDGLPLAHDPFGVLPKDD